LSSCSGEEDRGFYVILPLKLKWKIYPTKDVVWIKNQHENKISIAEMRCCDGCAVRIDGT